MTSKNPTENDAISTGRLQIKKFDPHILIQRRSKNSAPVICVIGKRNTGKSEVIKNLLYYNRKIPSGIIISPTEAGNSFYSEFCPDLFIHHQFDPDILNKVLKRQKRKIKETGKHPHNDFFVVLDDCMYDCKNIGKDKNIREIFCNGRHFQITLIMSVQYIMDLPISLRSNVDYVFCMRENNTHNVERLYNSYFGIFPSKQSFSQAFNIITDNFGSIVLDNLSRSNKIEECVFWHRSPYPSANFRIGGVTFWKTHEQLYDRTRNDDDDDVRKLPPACELIL
uniref:Uncharacterized protein n=1 Tax=viral metagenome TaxID=1070528 RepID=A0A6C0CRB3_9ZZZZ